MIPEAWQNDHLMSASKKAYYRWNAYSMEPWDGPGLCLSVCLSVTVIMPVFVSEQSMYLSHSVNCIICIYFSEMFIVCQ